MFETFFVSSKQASLSNTHSKTQNKISNQNNKLTLIPNIHNILPYSIEQHHTIPLYQTHTIYQSHIFSILSARPQILPSQ